MNPRGPISPSKSNKIFNRHWREEATAKTVVDWNSVWFERNIAELNKCRRTIGCESLALRQGCRLASARRVTDFQKKLGPEALYLAGEVSMSLIRRVESSNLPQSAQKWPGHASFNEHTYFAIPKLKTESGFVRNMGDSP